MEHYLTTEFINDFANNLDIQCFVITCYENVYEFFTYIYVNYFIFCIHFVVVSTMEVV